MVSTVDSVALYKTRKVLRELSNLKGRGTELVSLYIPPGRALHEVSANLREEYGTASNIKSDTTRNHVQDALTRTMQRLKLYRQTPENGLVIFVGALATNGLGSEVVRVYEVVPPKPIQTYLYRCDDHFHLDPLRELLREEKAVGIIAIDATEAGLGIVTGERVDIADVITSGVSGKTRKGGQSARRYERQREMELTIYYRRVAEHAKRVFLEERQVQGMVISGPGPTKEDFLKADYLDYRLKNSILAILDIGYSGSEGVRETLDKADSVLRDIRVMEERKLVQRFLQQVHSSEGLAVTGVQEVLTALDRAAAELVLVSEDLGATQFQRVCKRCNQTQVQFATKREYTQAKQTLSAGLCPQCGGSDFELLETDLIEYLADRAISSGTRVEVISGKTEEGAMFRSFGGVAALLRYK